MEEKQLLGRITGMAEAYRQSWALFTAIELGVLDALFGRKLATEEVAQITRSAPHRLKSLLNLLAGYKLLVREGSLYSLHPDLEPLADPNRTDSIQRRLAHAIRTARSWPRATEAFRKDLPVRALAASDPPPGSDIEAFHASLGIGAYLLMKRLLPLLTLPAGCRILDVGGGFGDMCRPILETDPHARALVLESPPTATLGENQLRNQRFGGRIDFVGCDFIQDDLPQGFDLVLLSNILHIYDPPTNQELLSRLHRCLRDDGQIIVREIAVNDDYSGPETGLQFAMHMAINTEKGDVYPQGIIAQWLSGAGFDGVQPFPTLADLGLILLGHKRAPRRCEASGTIA